MPVPATSVRFAEVARRLAGVCRARGLVAPSFRSPPSDPRALRTLRRRADGGVVVAVRVRGRTLSDVAADLVDGVIAANDLTPERAESTRAELLADLEGGLPARAA